MKPRGLFQITEFENPNKSCSWRVTGTKPDGARIRENFKTREEALGRKQTLETEASNYEPDHRIATTRLSTEQLAEAERAFAELAGRQLMPAVKFYLENYREPVSQIALQAAMDEFIQERTAANDRPLTIRNLKQRVGNVVDKQPTKLLSAVTEDEIKRIVFRPGRGPVANDNNRRALLQFFNWATKKGYSAKNPVAGIEPIKIDREEPQILPLEKARAIMAAANGYKEGVLLPYVALGLFAGIRPTELSRITWRNIDLDQKIITLDAKIAKMRGRRVVEMEPNLVAWLLPHAVKKTPIKGKNWRRDFDAVKKAIGYGPDPKTQQPWIQDYLRHTAVSHHLAHFQHEGKTAAWAGNSPDIIQRHYKGLVKPAESAEFWTIAPGATGEIVPMPAQAQAIG